MASNSVVLALSGGGFRATLYHLGVIRFLYEHSRAGSKKCLLSQVTDIAAVSGGSITAAFVGAHFDEFTGTAEQFNAAASRLIRLTSQNIQHQVLSGSRDPIASYISALGRFYEGRMLDELGPRPSLQVHLLTTNLATGRMTSLSNDGIRPFSGWSAVDAQLAGRAMPIAAPRLSLAEAVAASSAFPLLFPPYFPVPADLGVEANHAMPVASEIWADGGIYDNSAIDFVHRLLAAMPVPPGVILASDAGKPFGAKLTEEQKQELRSQLLGIFERVSTTIDAQMQRLARLDSMTLRASLPSGTTMIECSLGTPCSNSSAIPEDSDRLIAQLQLIRTDLDRFDPAEVYWLIRRGYIEAERRWSLTGPGVVKIVGRDREAFLNAVVPDPTVRDAKSDEVAKRLRSFLLITPAVVRLASGTVQRNRIRLIVAGLLLVVFLFGIDTLLRNRMEVEAFLFPRGRAAFRKTVVEALSEVNRQELPTERIRLLSEAVSRLEPIVESVKVSHADATLATVLQMVAVENWRVGKFEEALQANAKQRQLLDRVLATDSTWTPTEGLGNFPTLDEPLLGPVPAVVLRWHTTVMHAVCAQASKRWASESQLREAVRSDIQSTIENLKRDGSDTTKLARYLSEAASLSFRSGELDDADSYLLQAESVLGTRSAATQESKARSEVFGYVLLMKARIMAERHKPEEAIAGIKIAEDYLSVHPDPAGMIASVYLRAARSMNVIKNEVEALQQAEKYLESSDLCESCRYAQACVLGRRSELCPEIKEKTKLLESASSHLAYVLRRMANAAEQVSLPAIRRDSYLTEVMETDTVQSALRDFDWEPHLLGQRLTPLEFTFNIPLERDQTVEVNDQEQK